MLWTSSLSFSFFLSPLIFKCFKRTYLTDVFLLFSWVKDCLLLSLLLLYFALKWSQLYREWVFGEREREREGPKKKKRWERKRKKEREREQSLMQCISEQNSLRDGHNSRWWWQARLKDHLAATKDDNLTRGCKWEKFASQLHLSPFDVDQLTCYTGIQCILSVLSVLLYLQTFAGFLLRASLDFLNT